MMPTPSRLDLVDQGEELLGLALGQRGGRLVEDQHGEVGAERLGDLHHLLLGAGQILRRCRSARSGKPRRSRISPARRWMRRACRGSQPRSVSAPRKRFSSTVSLRHQREFLEHGGDAAARAPGARESNVDRLAVGSGPRRAVGRLAPARIEISVDLPAPFSPNRTCTSPGAERRNRRRSSASDAGILLGQTSDGSRGAAGGLREAGAARCCGSASVMPVARSVAATRLLHAEDPA